MNKFVYISVILINFIFLEVYTQEFGSNEIGLENENSASPAITFKPDVSVTLGTSFTSFGPGFNAFGTYIMPEITMHVSKKFAIRAGIGYSSMFLSSPENSGSIFGQNNLQYGTVYVSGLYQVNPKLSIAGSAFKTFNLATINNETNAHALDFSNEGISVNVDYKVSENVRFNVGFSYQKRSPYNYYYNPNGFNMHPSPFHSNGFGNGLGPGF